MVKRISLAYAVLLLGLAGAAMAQDPPPDLLAHVQPGQLWTLRTEQDGRVRERSMLVVEVHPTRVRYLEGHRETKDGRVTSAGIADRLEEWSWPPRHGPHIWSAEQLKLNAREQSQARRRLEVPGMALDCLVQRQQPPGSVMEEWIAVRGGVVTFPGRVKAAHSGATFDVLVDVKPGTFRDLPRPLHDMEPGALPREALQHVRAGQRWVFRGGEAPGEVVHTILDVDAHGSVTYLVPGDEPDELPRVACWRAAASPSWVPVDPLQRRTLERSGVIFELVLMSADGWCPSGEDEDQGPPQVWVPVVGEHEVFPGATAVERLVRVEEP